MYERRTEEILALVQNSIPALPMTHPPRSSSRKRFELVVRELESSRASILTQIQTLAKPLPEYSFIREMACIGDTSTPLVIQRLEILEISISNTL